MPWGSLSLRDFTEVLVKADGTASANDGKVLTRAVDLHKATRADLRDEVAYITDLGLAERKIRYGTLAIGRYLADTATGIEAEFVDLHPKLAAKMESEGVDSAATLLARSKTAIMRESLGVQLGIPAAEVYVFAKQADLMRAGVDARVARAMVEVGIDSVRELSRRNARNLASTLGGHAASFRFVQKFNAPSTSAVQRAIDAAETLDPAFAANPGNGSGFAALSPEERLEMLNSNNVDSGYWDAPGNPTYEDRAFIAAFELGAISSELEELRKDAVYGGINWAFYEADIDDRVEEIIAGTFDPYANVDPEYSEASLGVDAEVEILRYKGEFVGARFHWSSSDGVEDWWMDAVYDHNSGQFVQVTEGDSA